MLKKIETNLSQAEHSWLLRSLRVIICKMVGGTNEKACYNSRNEKFRNSNRNYKDKLHQQNEIEENLRH